MEKPPIRPIHERAPAASSNVINGLTEMPPTVYPLSKTISCREIEERIQRYGPTLHAIRARQPLDSTKRCHVLVKDNIGLDGYTAPAGSYALRDLLVPDAFCVRKLKDAGIDVFGKTHLRELAGFVTTKHPNRGYSYLGGFGVNPHGDFPTGSSSSGSGVAVAAGLCDAALGTETNGSLMSPGLHCGVWAIKPTRGLVSRSDIVPLSHSLDTPGVLARDVATLETILLDMAGTDPNDPATGIAPEILSEIGSRRERTFKLGILRWPMQAIDSETQAAFESFRAAIERQGIDCVDIPADSIAFDYKTIVSLDFVSDMDAFLGRYASGSVPGNFRELYDFYRSHPEVRPYGMDRLDDAFAMERPSKDEYNTLVASNIAKANTHIDTLLERYGCDALIAQQYVAWWAIAGAPSLAVPIGCKASGEPIGIMAGCALKRDLALLELGKAFEQALQ